MTFSNVERLVRRGADPSSSALRGAEHLTQGVGDCTLTSIWEVPDMSRWLRFGLGAAVVAVVLVVAGWFDGTVMTATQKQVSTTFDIGPVLPIRALGYLIIAGGSLAIGITGWRLRSLGLAIAYVVAGAFFTFLDTITWKLAAQINDAPPVLPDPIARAIGQVYFWQNGLLNADLIIGAATLIVGLAMLVATVPRSSVVVRTKVPRPVGAPGPESVEP